MDHDEEIHGSIYHQDEGLPGFLEEPSTDYDGRKDFVTLRAWQHARDLKLFFYQQILPKLPPDERYALGIQIRKAAVSITANIAEGYGRFHYKESVQFYRISRGSIYELKDFLITCLDLSFIDRSLFDQGWKLTEEAKSTLNGYIKFVQNQAKNAT